MEKEVRELSKMSIAAIVAVVVLFMAGMAYLFLGHGSNSEENADSVSGKTVSLSKEDQEVLDALSINIIKRAGTFGLKLDEVTPQSVDFIMQIRKQPDSELFSDYFVTRASQLNDMKEAGLLYPGGKVYFNTSRWDEDVINESMSYASFTVDNISPDVPKNATNDGSLTFAEVPVSYNSKLFTATNLQMEAPAEGEKYRVGIEGKTHVFADQKAVLTFVLVGDSWELYNFKNSKTPYTTVFWNSPDFSKVLEAVGTDWQKGETIEE